MMELDELVCDMDDAGIEWLRGLYRAYLCMIRCDEPTFPPAQIDDVRVRWLRKICLAFQGRQKQANEQHRTEARNDVVLYLAGLVDATIAAIDVEQNPPRQIDEHPTIEQQLAAAGEALFGGKDCRKGKHNAAKAKARLFNRAPYPEKSQNRH